MKKHMRVLILSYGWNSTVFDKGMVLEKLVRDGMCPEENTIYILQRSFSSFTQIISPHVRLLGLKSTSQFLRPWYDILSFFYIPFILYKNKFKPDVVVIYDASLVLGGVWSKFFGNAKIIFFVTNLPKDLIKTRGMIWMRNMYQSIAEYCALIFADYFFVINETTKKYVEECGVRKEAIFTITPNVIERDMALINQSKKGHVRMQYALSKDVKIILTVARLEKEKGVEDLLSAFALLDSTYVLFVCGAGSLDCLLKKQALHLGVADRVFFTGYISRKDIWNYYLDADVFVLLSSSEALGLVFWEAMFMGVPVIGAQVGGIVETIGAEGERGFLVESGKKVSEVVKAIQKACKKNDTIEAMKVRAKAYVDVLLEKKVSIHTIFETM